MPAAKAASVLAVASAVGGGALEPLCDPLTLQRFLDARDGDVAAAVAMHEETVAWRRSFGIAKLMARFGSGAAYDDGDAGDNAAADDDDNGQWKTSGGGGTAAAAEEAAAAADGGAGQGSGASPAGRATPSLVLVGAAGAAAAVAPSPSSTYYRADAGPWTWKRQPNKSPADKLLAQCSMFFVRLPDKPKKKSFTGVTTHEDDLDEDGDDDWALGVGRLGRADYGGLGREGSWRRRRRSS